MDAVGASDEEYEGYFRSAATTCACKRKVTEMPSAAEQLAKNANWGALAKATDLKKAPAVSFWVHFDCLSFGNLHSLYPGLIRYVWNEIFTQKGGGILDMFNMFSGGALSRMTIFALNIMPYISASIIMQLASAMSPQAGSHEKRGRNAGRMKINQYTRYFNGFALGYSSGLWPGSGA